MKYLIWAQIFLSLLVLPMAHAAETPHNAFEPISGPIGGDTTQHTRGKNSFGLPAANINRKDLRVFFFGNKLFNTNWVIAPASVRKLDGLGPTFNRVSCSSCHLRDGRGHPPEKYGEKMLSMLIRLSVPGKNAAGGPKPHPAYGDQLNDRSIPGVPAEGRALIETTERAGKFADGTSYSLSVPTYHFTDLAFGPLGDDIMFSPRVAPAVIGLGLLEAIPEKDIQALADPDDRDGNGISGRINHVWDPSQQKTRLGRFGWKANVASLMQQNAAAANGDIGITSTLFPDENCPPAQKACASAPKGKGPQLSNRFLKKLTLYTEVLAVPARRHATDPEVMAGERLFTEIGCSNCHIPTFVTGKKASLPLLENQKIHPFTDLLLHDMGPDLADGRPDFEASGTEWRTPPLWGIGLVEAVNKHTRFLHDGRARSIEEAILWHGGEAEAAKEKYRSLDKRARHRLLAFLNSL